MKKTRKNYSKLIVAGLVATCLLASCKKENTGDNHSNLNLDGISFTACTESGDHNAKTYLDGQDIKWMAGDLILVQNSANQQAPFEVVDGLTTMNGTFYTGSTFDRSPSYVAAYPYDKVTISGTTATFTLPQQQQMTQTGTFGNGAMPMVATSSNNVLPFYNVCGGVCFPLQGAGKHVTKIVLTSKNASDKLWGTFTADCTAVPVANNVTSGPMPTFVTGSAGSNSVELICNGNTGITLTAEPQDFYIMVPPQTMTTGFTVTAYDGNNVIYNQDINWDAATHANFIKRSVVSKVQTAITISDPLTVTTVSPTFISQTQAYGQGTVASDVANNITERGVCWALASVTTTPTIANSCKAEGGTATGAFALMFGDTNPMTKDCVYYVRAYAKNAAGEVFYGDPIPFATRKDYSNDYNGRMPYAYSVSASQQVNFSMGNLQYKASTNTWRFAEYQFEYVGGVWTSQSTTYGNVYSNGEHPNASLNGIKSDNANVSSSYNQWIDLFGWGTSGWNNTNDALQVFYQPWETSDIDFEHNYYNIQGYGPSSNMPNRDLTGTNHDWGVYNNISNDGSFGTGSWRTMTGSTGGEWDYLISRSQTYCYAQVEMNVRNNQIISGLIVFPDGFSWPSYVATTLTCNTPSGGNYLNEAEWSLLEKWGAVYLPNAGSRIGTLFSGGFPQYWTSTHDVNGTQTPGMGGDEGRGAMAFISFAPYMVQCLNFVRSQGCSVRLVRNVN